MNNNLTGEGDLPENMPSKHVKIRSSLPNGDAESVWAKPVDGGYQIENLPFFHDFYGYRDIVSADDDGEFVDGVTRLTSQSVHHPILQYRATVHAVPRFRTQGLIRTLPTERQSTQKQLIQQILALSEDIHVEFGQDFFFVLDAPDDPDLRVQIEAVCFDLKCLLLGGFFLMFPDLIGMKWSRESFDATLRRHNLSHLVTPTVQA